MGIKKKMQTGEYCSWKECDKIAKFRCSVCKRALYCSAECQRAHWSIHRRECVRMVSDEQCGIHIDPTIRGCELPGRTPKITMCMPLARPFDITESDPSIIGEGARGTISRVEMHSGKPVVIKEMKAFPVDRETTVVGNTVTRHIRDPNIMNICAMGYLSIDRSTIVMEMDSAAMDLNDLMYETHKRENGFTVIELKSLAYQLVRGVAVLHSRLINHLDLKSENVLVFSRDMSTVERLTSAFGDRTFKQLMISDFDCTRGNYVGLYYLDGNHGTPGYRPPEDVFGRYYIATHKYDVWSVGCILYELAIGKYLINTDKDERSEMTALLGSTFLRETMGSPKIPKDRDGFATDVRYDWFPNFSGGGEETLTDKLKNPKIARHPGLGNLISRMLVAIPQDRCDIFEALHDPYFDDPTIGLINLAIPRMHPIIPVLYNNDSLTVKNEDVARIYEEEEMRCWARRRDLNMINPNLHRDHVMNISYVINIYKEDKHTTFHIFMEIEARAVYILEKYEAISDVSVLINSYLTNGLDITFIAFCKLAQNFSSTLFKIDRTKLTFYDKVCRTESEIFEKLDFDVSGPTSFDFLDLFIKMNNIVDPTTILDAHLLRRIFSTDLKFVSEYKPSEIAAACVFTVIRRPVIIRETGMINFTPIQKQMDHMHSIVTTFVANPTFGTRLGIDNIPVIFRRHDLI